MNDMHDSSNRLTGKSARLAWLQLGVLPLVLALGGCAGVVVGGGSGNGDGQGGGGGSGVTTSAGSTMTGGATDGGAGDDVATSESTPPYGVWSMIVQFGPPGTAVGPTIPMQVEMRPDGTAFAWLCAGAPDDGSFAEVCAKLSRHQCWIGTVAWTGVRWRVDFPAAHVGGVPEQGDITPDGKGNILISYVNPTYSGALFTRLGEITPGGDACIP